MTSVPSIPNAITPPPLLLLMSSRSTTKVCTKAYVIILYDIQGMTCLAIENKKG